MNEHTSSTLDNFYFISRLLDDDMEIVHKFFCSFIPQEYSRYTFSEMKKYIDRRRFVKLDKEIDFILDINVNLFNAFKEEQYRIRELMPKEDTREDCSINLFTVQGI